MSHYFSDIKQGLVQLVQSSTKVKYVYDYENTKPEGYPAVTVTPNESDGEFLDTSRIRRDITFKIRVYQERLDVGPSEAERIATNTVDDILAIFDNKDNTTISNTVVFMPPVKTTWGYVQAPDADVRSCEIDVVGTVAQ